MRVGGAEVGVPRVQVRIEVQHGDRPVAAGGDPQQRQRDCMVAAEETSSRRPRVGFWEEYASMRLSKATAVRPKQVLVVGGIDTILLRIRRPGPGGFAGRVGGQQREHHTVPTATGRWHPGPEQALAGEARSLGDAL